MPAGGFQEMAGVGDGYTDDADYRAMGIEANRPTEAKPGSEDKVLILAARYAAGLPLWHTDDCCDHAPGPVRRPARRLRRRLNLA